MKMTPIKSLYELESLGSMDQMYEQLAIISAKNLGGDNITSLDKAMSWLRINAMEAESGEQGVIDEVNFCRDLVPKPGKKKVSRR